MQMITMRSQVAEKRPLAKRLAGGLAGLALSTAALLSPQAWAQPLSQTLDQVASNAEVVIVVPSLSKVNEAVAQLNRDLQLGIPQLNNPLALVKGMAGFGEGFNDDGAAVLVIPGISEAIVNETDPEPLLLIPVTDYAAFAQGLGGAAEGVSAITLGTDAGFTKKLGSFAVFGEEQETVATYAAGNTGAALLEKLGDYAGQYADDSLGLMIVDVEAMAPVLGEKLDEAMAMMAEEMANSSPMDMSSMMGVFESVAEEFIQNTKTVTVGMDMARGGVGLTFSANFKEDSELAKLLPGAAGSAKVNDALLRRLPAESYLIASSMDFNAVNLPLFMEMAQEVADSMGDVAFMEGMMDIMTQAMGMYEDTNGYAQAFYTMPPMMLMSGEGMKTATVMQVEDSEAFAGQYEKMLNGMSDAMSKMFAGLAEMSGEEIEEGAVSMDTEFQANALEIEGVRVDRFGFKVNLPEEAMQELQAANPMATMGMNTSGFVGYVDENTVVTTTPLDEALIQSSVASAKAANGIGTDTVLAAVRVNDMPQNAFAEGYLSFTGVAEMVGSFMMGDPAAIPVPQGLPPVSMGLGAKQGQVVGRIYVPLDTMRFVKDTAMMFMGGGNNVSAPRD